MNSPELVEHTLEGLRDEFVREFCRAHPLALEAARTLFPKALP